MHYLIDGHNLIGKLPDLALDDPDDEVKLVLRLRSWTARSRKRRVTVVFDGGLPGGVDRGLSTSAVRVKFASSGRTADAILINDIERAANPREFTLVSSDNHIRRQAQARRMLILKAEVFAQKLVDHENTRQETAVKPPVDADQSLSSDEVAMWLDLFGAQDDPS